MRDLSVLREATRDGRLRSVERTDRAVYRRPQRASSHQLGRALYAGDDHRLRARHGVLLRRRPTRYGYNLDLEAVARIWRGGCIIRAALLEDIRMALSRPARICPTCCSTPGLSAKVIEPQEDLRAVVRRGRSWVSRRPG